ncbi:hypothetical protein [Flavobacterium sp.]|uniref:hypothetical protein n=1 Tax=Flavobacterium sp. TaxID=239 RepID=UPI002B4AD89F|nr:hypothetical protein [Flavobacterium sp.]HLF51059.1 hypothetical protein [Flavobacterium sp.]
MNKNADGFFKSLEQLFLKANFTRLNSDFDNIDEIYNNNINIWYYFQSDCVTKKDGNKEVNSKLDTINNNILLNPDNFIFCKTQKGFPLTEVNFIDTEIKNLLLIDRDKLSFSEQNQIKFYSEYLSKKRNHIEWTNNDYYNHYIETKRFAFQVFWAFKSNEYDKVINDLKEYKSRYDYIFNKLSNESKIEFKNDFCDRLEKLKNKQTESKFKEVITNFIENINNEYYNIASNENYKIDEYKKSYNQQHFNKVITKLNEDGTPNHIYLGNYFSEWLGTNKSFFNNESLKEKHGLLSDYNKQLYFLTNYLIALFKAVNGYEKSNDRGFLTAIKINEDRVLRKLKDIEFFNKRTLKNDLLNDNIITIIDAKEYCIELFADCINSLKDVFDIDIKKSPLNENFENSKLFISNAIDLEYFKLRTTTEAPQQIEDIISDEVINKHNDIFKDNAFQIWQNMFNHFEITESQRTDLDFMFQVMKYNNLIHKNIGLTDIKVWINDTYHLSVEKIKYTDIKSSANKNRMATYKLITS